MKVRTALVVIGVAALGAAAWSVVAASAAPVNDPADVGTVVILPIVGADPAGLQRTPPPGAPTTDPDFEAEIDPPAQDADGNLVPPIVTVLGKG